MKGKLTQKFFDNAWKGLKHDRYSANYEFVEAAKENNFDLHGILEIKEWERGSSLDGRRCKYIVVVPFDTFQYSPFGSTHWHKRIPLLDDEVEIVK